MIYFQNIKALNHDPYNWDVLLYVIYTKFDVGTRRKWESEVSRGDLLYVQLMMGFFQIKNLNVGVNRKFQNINK